MHICPDLGCQGLESDLKTPHIDALAENGVRFTDGYITSPQCVPSRGGILTGTYQNRFGLESNTEGKTPEGLAGFNQSLTIAERLRPAGYRCGMAGKWHLGPVDGIHTHGFDWVYARNSARPGTARFGKEESTAAALTESLDALYHIDACSEAAVKFINQSHEDPFFFYLAYRAPHVPLDATPKYLDRFPGEMPQRRRQALAMISAMDDGVGRITETLRELGILEDTLIWFIGDNGAPIKMHKLDEPGGGPGWDGSINDPLNGEKGMLSEGGIRVPFLASWPGTLPSGLVYERPVISLDVAATAVALAGLDPDPKLDGVNLIPVLQNPDKAPSPHETLFWRWIDQAAIRQGDWKLIQAQEREYLFHLADDIAEKDNLLTTEAEIAARLRARLHSWTETLDPPSRGAFLGSKKRIQTAQFFDWFFHGKKTAAQAPPKPPTPSEDRAIFENRDANRDGEVTWEEYLKGRSSQIGSIRKAFDRRDLDGDGVWQKSELPPAPDQSPGPMPAAAPVTPSPTPAPAPTADLPNVIVILADDLGYADTTLYGHTQLYQTPNLERLAARGMTFSRAYSNSPLCSPTRASLLTGQCVSRHGSTAPQHHTKDERLRATPGKNAPPDRKAIIPQSATRLDPEFTTLGRLFRSADYRTAHFGKWHLGPDPFSPLQHGFEIDIPHHPGPGPAGSYVAPWKFSHFKANSPGEHIEDRIASELSEFIKKHRDERFFINYWQFSVHGPFDAKPDLIAKYEDQIDLTDRQNSPTYAAMVHSLDDGIGTVLDTLDETGLADRTAILFISDNGGNYYNLIEDPLRYPTSNHPLRGGKATIWEGGIRVPAIVAWPGLTEPGSRSNEIIQAADFFSTLTTRLRLEPPSDHVVDAIDLSPALGGEPLQREAIFTYFPHQTQVPDWTPPAIAVHQGDWKLIRFFHQGEDQGHSWELYDLATDIGETNNLASENPEKVAALDRLITEHLEQTGAVTPDPNPRFDPEKYRPDLIGVPTEKMRKPKR
ncbi:MAG: sulfatase-like hydrolase/transferase [Verrucomicrobiota bacterium]